MSRWLLLLFLTPGDEETLYAPDELSIGRLFMSGTHQGKVVFSYTVYKAMKWELALLDLQTEKVRLIRDGRVKVVFPYVIPMADGFALINHADSSMANITFLDQEGEFREKRRIREFEGWDEDLDLVYAFPSKPGLAYLTLKHRQEPIWFLTLADLTKHRLDFLKNQNLENGYTHIWVCDRERLFLLTQQTGKIVMVDQDTFEVIKTLRRSEEPVIFNKKKFASIGSQKYVNNLEQPFFNGKYLGFQWLKQHDQFGEPYGETRVRSLSFSMDGLKESEESTLAIHLNKKLVYHLREKTLEIRPRVLN